MVIQVNGAKLIPQMFSHNLENQQLKIRQQKKLKHILKNCLEDKLGYLLNKFFIGKCKKIPAFLG